MKIKKAIIPAAGLGTRFLPFTKSVPKELLPIMNIPAIQFIIEEGLQSGIEEFEIIANKNKQAVTDYFVKNEQLQAHLTATGKALLIGTINQIIEQTHFNYIPQPEPLGLGHAILMAEKTIQDEYFGILLPDEIMMGTTPALSQLITIAQKYNATVIAVQEVPKESVSAYGIVAIKNTLEDNIFEVERLVEKPSIDTAPSQYAIIGRYVVSPQLFNSLKKIQPGAGNEIQLTDGISHMMEHGERVIAYKIDTVRHDIGNPTGWLQANIDYSLRSPEFSSKIKNYIKKSISQFE